MNRNAYFIILLTSMFIANPLLGQETTLIKEEYLKLHGDKIPLKYYSYKDSFEILLSIKSNKNEYLLSDTVFIKCTLENVSHSRVAYLNDLWGNDVDIIIRDETENKILKEKYFIDNIFPEIQPKSFRLMMPGDYWGCTFELSESTYGFIRGHIYSINCQMVSQNRGKLISNLKNTKKSDIPFIKKDMKDLFYINAIWEGKIESNTIKIFFM